MRSIASHVLVFTSCFFAAAIAACVPDFPEKLLADAAVLRHPSVVAALGEVEQTLSDLFVNTTRDGLSFAIVSLTHIRLSAMLKSNRSTLQRRGAYLLSAMVPSK